MSKKIISICFTFIFVFLGLSVTLARATSCQNDADCTSEQYCYQPPMPDCPEGMGCAAVMPAKYCANKVDTCQKNDQGQNICPYWDPAPGFCSDGTLINGGVDVCGCSLPPTCQYNSPTPSPSSSPLPTPISSCQTDADCEAGQTCYQPPMPECPSGMACIQVMPAKYCQNQDVIILGNDLPSGITFIDIATNSRYPSIYSLNSTQPKVQDPVGGAGYAMGFKFTGAQGQNLQTLVSELSIANVGSYIHTHLYGPNQKRITKADTRIDLTVSQAGTYYLIAQTFSNKEGDIAVQVFDRDEQKLKGSLIGQSLDAVFPPQILPTYGQNILNLGRVPFFLTLEFPDTITLHDDNIVEYFSKEAAKIIKIRPTLYRSVTSDIMTLVNSRSNIAPLAVTLTKQSDKVLTIRPNQMELFRPGYYYGFISDLILDQPGASGMNFYTYFAAISTSGKIADLNGDGKVNLADFTLLAGEFMSDKEMYQADINNDGRVNLADYTILVSEFGN